MVQNSTANQKRLKHQAEKKNDCISSEKKSEKKALEETAKSNLYSSLTLFMHGEGGSRHFFFYFNPARHSYHFLLF